MKLFRKKNRPSPRPSTPSFSASGTEQSFYSQRAGDAPLDEYSPVSGGQSGQQTSKHSPARRRENNNRASSWALARLLLRAVLIVLLLAGGFIILRLVLTRLAEPSEKEQQRWEQNALLMEKTSEDRPAGALAASDQSVDLGRIEQRLIQWEQTERNFRSAEALSQRGIDDEALPLIYRALQNSPNHQGAQKLLLDIYMRRSMFSEAIPLCIRLLDQNSQQPDLQMDLLIALKSNGQTEAGLLLADRILLDQPRNLTVLLIAATGQLALGNTDAALTSFERMLEVNAKNKDALIGCGTIYFNREDYAQAVPYFMELLRLNPEPKYYKTLALCYAQQNQVGKTMIFLGQALSLFGDVNVASWLNDLGFNPVRESGEFRSFADKLVGAENRKAIEAISKREIEEEGMKMPDKLAVPQKPELNVILPVK